MVPALLVRPRADPTGAGTSPRRTSPSTLSRRTAGRPRTPGRASRAVRLPSRSLLGLPPACEGARPGGLTAAPRGEAIPAPRGCPSGVDASPRRRCASAESSPHLAIARQVRASPRRRGRRSRCARRRPGLGVTGQAAAARPTARRGLCGSAPGGLVGVDAASCHEGVDAVPCRPAGSGRRTGTTCVSRAIRPDRISRPIRFGMAIRPFAMSENVQTRQLAPCSRRRPPGLNSRRKGMTPLMPTRRSTLRSP